MKEEAENLTARFKGVKNRAEFARNYAVKGGDSMISQHMSGHRPISLQAALVYAEAFRCNIEDISPRLAAELQQAASLMQPGERQKTDEPAMPRLAPVDTALSADELIRLNNYYRDSLPKDRAAIMNLAETAADRARKARGKPANDHS